MRLNDLHPGARQKPKRVGRGIGSGTGKTCGRGHKGMKSRAGGKVAPGFEGGQMPLAKRVPKYGFSSRIARRSAQLRLSDIGGVAGDEVSLDSLREAGIVGPGITQAKIFASGKVERALKIVGLRVSRGAATAIEAAGGNLDGALQAGAGDDAGAAAKPAAPAADDAADKAPAADAAESADKAAGDTDAAKPADSESAPDGEPGQ